MTAVPAEAGSGENPAGAAGGSVPAASEVKSVLGLSHSGLRSGALWQLPDLIEKLCKGSV